MRKPKALVIPFRFREGYPEDLVNEQIASAQQLLDETELESDFTKVVVFNDDADEIVSNYNAENYDFVVLLVPTWIEPVLVVRVAKPYFNKPIVVWGFGTFNKKGARVGLGSTAGAGVVKGTLREMGVKHEYLYHLPGNPETDEKIKTHIRKVANVARAISLLDKSRFATVGYLFGGMSIGDIDVTKMRTKFGPELMHIDAYSLIRRMEAIDSGSPAYIEGREHVESHLAVTIGDRIDRIVRMYVVLKAFVDEHDLKAITLKCHFELSQEYGLTPCIPLSVIGNAVVASCEADIPVLLTQTVMNYLAGGMTTTYADIHELTGKNALVGACGYAPSSMCLNDQIICDVPDENSQGLGATFSGYITNKNHLKEGVVTMGRFLKEPDGRFTLHFTTGNALGDIGKVSELDMPQYPFTEIALDGDLDEFAQNMGSHHYAIVYADIREELSMFCKYKDMQIIR